MQLEQKLGNQSLETHDGDTELTGRKTHTSSPGQSRTKRQNTMGCKRGFISALEGAMSTPVQTPTPASMCLHGGEKN